MLHRDLKPANVLLMADGTPKVSDFGLVKFADPIEDVSELYATMTLNPIDEGLRRFARELGAQYKSIADATSVTDDQMTRDAWSECAARTGLLSDETRLVSVQEFLHEAREQSRHAPPDLNGLTTPGAVMGSPSYMAPEQARGDLAALGPRTDVYALGGILYEIMTAQPPFKGSSVYELIAGICTSAPVRPRAHVPEISADIEAVCLKCLEKSPDSRYQTAGELADDLARFLEGYTPRAVGNRSTVAVHGPEEVTTPGSTSRETAPPSDTTVVTRRNWWPFGTRARE
jgi:serine/threonine protein kinase